MVVTEGEALLRSDLVIALVKLLVRLFAGRAEVLALVVGGGGGGGNETGLTMPRMAGSNRLVGQMFWPGWAR